MGIAIKKSLFILMVLLSFTMFSQSDSSKFHLVKAGETKYGIAKKYDITIQQLEDFNPEIKDGLKVGVQLLIPSVDKVKHEVPETGKSKDFIFHEVKSKQTLYSLAKDYGVSMKAILDYNPKVAEQGLDVGMLLKIPIKNLDEVQQDDSDTNFHIHKVAAGETAYSISRKYRLKIDSLYLLNPRAKDGLQIGQEIRIPIHLVKPKPKEVKDPDKPVAQLSTDEGSEEKDTADILSEVQEDYFLYKVKKGDSYYSFKQRFLVSQDELLALNPELKQGLKLGKYIILPRKKEAPKTNWLDRLFNQVDEPKLVPLDANTKKAKNQMNVVVNSDEIVKLEPKDTVRLVRKKKTNKVALILPFNAINALDTSRYKNFDIPRNTQMAIHFQNGLMMAADSMAKRGMNIDLSIYDSEQNLNKVKKLAELVDQEEYDLVIGPAFKKNVEYLATKLVKKETLIVSPLSSKASVVELPNLIQVIPGDEGFSRKVAAFLNNDFQDANLVFAHSGTPSDMEIAQDITARLIPRSDSDFISTAVITKDDFSRRSALSGVVKDGKKTAIVLIGGDKVFISDVIGKLNALRDTNIYLFADSQLKSMTTVENEYLNNLNLIMPEFRYINYGDKETQQFISGYREKYGVEPSVFAFQAYDIGIYFMEYLFLPKRFIKFGLDYRKPKKGLSIGFDFKRLDGGGYYNQYMYSTGIRNFELVEIPLNIKGETQEVEEMK